MRRALRSDLDQIVDIWTDAFSGDPYLRWIAPDDEVYAIFAPQWMGFIAALALERGHTFVSDASAIAWIPPDLSLVGPDDLARGRGIIETHSSETHAEEALDVILRARSHAGEEAHWVLQYVGVRAAARSQGAGRDAVAPGLATVDADGVPCELTSTNPRNVAFYKRLGFVVHAEESTVDGSVTLRPMRRAVPQ